MKQRQAERLSIIFAAIFLSAVFLPIFLVDYGTFFIKRLGVGPHLLGTVLLVNGILYAVFNILSLLFFCLNVFYRFRLSKGVDWYFAINLALMPVPVIFFFTGLYTLVFNGLPVLFAFLLGFMTL